MDKKNLEKNVRDWALGLGFSTSNGSAPASNYFAVFTSTPNRRQFCDLLLGTIQSRKQVEFLRKQVFAAKLLQGIKTVKTFSRKDSRFENSLRQNNLEKKVKETRRDVKELESNILFNASDLMFETCKVAELKKNCESYKERVLVLQLLSRKKHKLVAEIEKFLIKKDFVNQFSLIIDHPCNTEVKLKELKNILLCIKNEKNCDDTLYNIDVGNIRKSLVTEENLWEEEISCKNQILEKFNLFLDNLNSKDKCSLSGKKVTIEKALQSFLTQLKQNITERSLNVILVDSEGQLLFMQICRILEMILESNFNNSEIPSLNGNISLFSQEETNESCLDKNEFMKEIEKYVDCLGMKSYFEFLTTELHAFEHDYKKIFNFEKEKLDVEKELCEILKSIELLLNEIDRYKSDLEKLQKEILFYKNKIELTLNQNLSDNYKGKGFTQVEEIISFLKISFDKQMELFLNTSLDAFKISTVPSKNNSFVGDDLYHEKFKKFFSNMLLSSSQDIDSILKELEKRKGIVQKINNFISEKERLSNVEEECFRKLTSINCDSEVCKKYFKDSDGILWNVSSKADNLSSSIDFCFKILKNWLEQPYRLMIRDDEKLNGKTLKEYEEQYKKKYKSLKAQ